VPTTVDGTLQDLQTLTPLTFSSCGDKLRLLSGAHRLAAAPSGGLVLTTAALLPATQPTPAARSAAVAGSWGAESRRVRLGPGAASYLALTENFNEGWRATLNGQRLRAVRLDGWRQAWVVPAGRGGVVHLSFPPGHLYHWLLVAGGAGIAVLLGLALWPWRRRRAPPARSSDALTGRLRTPHSVPVGAALAAGFVLGGVLGVLVCTALLLVPRRPARLPAVAGVAFALAGIAVFLSPGRLPGSASGAFGAPAQLLAMVAVVAVAVSLVRVEEKT